MTKYVLLGLAVMVAASFVVVEVVRAGDPVSDQPNREARKVRRGLPDEVSAQVGDLGLAGQLAAYGRRCKDPVALLAAARILKDTPTKAGVEKPEMSKVEGVTGEQKVGEPAPFTADALLSEAKALSGEDAALAAIAESTAARKARGQTAGPETSAWRVDVGYTNSHKRSFRGGELARVVIIGDGSTDLDFYVYDENGYLIASDTDATDVCDLGWWPKWTGVFEIKVVNNGRVWNGYTFATN